MLLFSGGSDKWRDWTAGSSTPGSGGSQPTTALRAAARHQRDLGKVRCQAWSKTGQLGFASHAVYFTCCFLSIIRCRCLEWGRLLATCPPSGEPGLTSAQSGSSRWPSTERTLTANNCILCARCQPGWTIECRSFYQRTTGPPARARELPTKDSPSLSDPFLSSSKLSDSTSLC